MTKTEDRFKINENLDDLGSLQYDSLELILSRLDEVIKILHHKAVKGRVTKPENEKVRIQWIKALAYTCSVYNQIKKDIDVEELNNKIEVMTNEIKKLKEAQEYEKEY